MDDQSAHPTRRALLGAAVGVAAAVAADALGRPTAVRAGVDGDVVLGTENRSTSLTSILNDSAGSGTTAFKGWTYGTGLGVDAVSLLGTGLHAESRSPAAPALRAANRANWTGIIGASIGPSSLEPDGIPETGVYGYAEDGEGVRGETTTTAGIGGRFRAPSGGTGLSVTGKARFDRSGVVNVAKGRSYVDVTVPGGLTASSVVLATIQTYRAGVSVAGVRRNYPSAGRARIYLTKVASASASTPVGWMVIS